MKWARAIASGTLTGVAVCLILLVAQAIGIPNLDEFLLVLPIVAIELALLYAAILTILYFPVAAFFCAAGWRTVARLAGIALLPMPLLLLRGIGTLFNLNKRPTLADDVAFLLQDPGTSVSLFAGLAAAGIVFVRVATEMRGQPPNSLKVRLTTY